MICRIRRPGRNFLRFFFGTLTLTGATWDLTKIGDLDFVFMCETWSIKNISLPLQLQQRGFSSVQVDASKPVLQGRASGAILCIFNKNLYQVDSIVKKKTILF